MNGNGQRIVINIGRNLPLICIYTECLFIHIKKFPRNTAAPNRNYFICPVKRFKSLNCSFFVVLGTQFAVFEKAFARQIIAHAVFRDFQPRFNLLAYRRADFRLPLCRGDIVIPYSELNAPRAKRTFIRFPLALFL